MIAHGSKYRRWQLLSTTALSVTNISLGITVNDPTYTTSAWYVQLDPPPCNLPQLHANSRVVHQCMKGCMDLLEAEETPFATRKPEWETPPVVSQDQECWTYGDSILSNTNRGRYGVVLCELVAKCMLRTPSQRPSLEVLLATITAQLALPTNNIPPFYDGSQPGGFFTEPAPPPESTFKNDWTAVDGVALDLI